MGMAMDETYTRAGILKKAGSGLVMDIAGEEFFLIPDDLRALLDNRMAEIVNHRGECEGLAWLSPLVSVKKVDMTGMISRHIYVVPYRGFRRVMRGERQQTPVQEYRPHGPGKSSCRVPRF
jgi:hypothetical protein